MSLSLPCRWQDLTSHEVAALPGDAVAVMVLGAIEQHGGHLPLSTDLDIGEGLLEAALDHLPNGFPLVILPSLTLGASDEHLHFPGTVSLPVEAAIATLKGCGGAVARAGLKRLVLFNAHGGNQAVMEIAALALRRHHDLLVVKSHYMHMPPPGQLPAGGLPVEELRHGLHGGAVETAMMRYLAPDKVRPDALEYPRSSGETLAAAGHLVGPEGEASYAWLAEDLHPGGVVGNARLGTAELGERLVAHYAKRLAHVLRDTRALTLPASAPQSRRD